VDGYPEYVLNEGFMIGYQAVNFSRWQYNLVGDRLYRLTRLPEEVSNEIQKFGGTQLDPRMVEFNNL